MKRPLFISILRKKGRPEWRRKAIGIGSDGEKHVTSVKFKPNAVMRRESAA